MSLLAMIPLFVERLFKGLLAMILLFTKGGSVRLGKSLLAMIPKSVKCGSARVLLPMIPINQQFPQQMDLPGCGSARTQKPCFLRNSTSKTATFNHSWRACQYFLSTANFLSTNIDFLFRLYLLYNFLDSVLSISLLHDSTWINRGNIVKPTN